MSRRGYDQIIREIPGMSGPTGRNPKIPEQSRNNLFPNFLTMKGKSFFKSLAAVLMLMVFSLTAGQSQTCDNFNGPGPGNWLSLDASTTITSQVPNSDGSTYLRVEQIEPSGPIWLLNNTINSADFAGCGTLCWDFKIFDDGFAFGSTPVNAVITIFDGTIENPTLSATFFIQVPLYEGSRWTNICAPLKRIALNAPLPSNGQGSWIMDGNAGNNDWNQLLNTFDGVAIRVDVEGAEDDAIIGIDNFCFQTCCPDPFNADFTMTTLCNNGYYSVTATASDPSAPTHTWQLMATTQPNQTTGGVQEGAAQTGTSPTFNLSISKFYYIIHQVSQADCQPITEARHVVPKPQANNVFNLENAAGTNKVVFCYGEDVYLDGTASSGEAAHYISVERLPGGGYYTLSNNPGGMIPGTVGIVNLTQAFAAKGLYFVPGNVYRVKLALQNVANCISWTEQTINFTVECNQAACPVVPNFKIISTSIPGTNSYVLSPEPGFNDYSAYGAQNEWYILNQTGPNGAYNLLSLQSGPTFSYVVEIGQPCVFVVRRLVTDCGTFCFGRAICYPGLTGEECEICGVVDCDILDGLCIPPSNPQVTCDAPNIPKLFWDAVQNASGYQVEITYNDPKCCFSETPSNTITYQVSTNALYLGSFPQPSWNCFSWRVAPVLPNSPLCWTASQCFAGCSKERSNALSDEVSGQSPPARLYPNPASDRVEISFATPYSGTLQLFDMAGRVLESLEVTEQQAVQLNTERLTPGIYWISVQGASERTMHKLIKQ